MSTNDNRQLYDDVHHCLQVLVNNLVEEIHERVSDLVLDGKIKISDFFERYGIENDSCDQHVFQSSYQSDIIKRVERKLSANGYRCRVTVTGKYIAYTTRVPHPWKPVILAVLAGMVAPLLVAPAAYRLRSLRKADVPDVPANVAASSSLETPYVWHPYGAPRVVEEKAENSERVPPVRVYQRPVYVTETKNNGPANGKKEGKSTRK